jgi:hypothetical protein
MAALTWTGYLRQATTHGGGGGAATADASAAMSGWRDPDAEPPAEIAAAILADWPAARHPELVTRARLLAEHAAGGQPGMGTLAGRLAESFAAETGRGDAEVWSLLTWWLERPQLWPSSRDEEGWLAMSPDPEALQARMDAAARTAAPSANGQAAPQARQETAQDGRPPDDVLLDGIRDGAWLDGYDPAPLEYHVDGLVPEGLAELVGAPKAGKSWLVLGWGLDVARDGRPVLYLALEDSDRRMKRRCARLTGGGPVPPLFQYKTRLVHPAAAADTVAAYLRRHAGDDVKPLVILDTLGKALGPALRGESQYDRDYRVTSALKDAVYGCPGAALLICHHDRKATGEDWLDKASGTRGITGGPDTVLLLLRPREEAQGTLHITGRDVEDGAYAVTFADGRWTLDGGSLPASAGAYRLRQAKAGLGDQSAGIVAMVNAAGEDGVRVKAVAGAFGMTTAAASAYLTRMHERGRIRRDGRGTYKSVVCVVSQPPVAPALQPTQHTQHNPTLTRASQPGPSADDIERMRAFTAGLAPAGYARPEVPPSPGCVWLQPGQTCPGCGGTGSHLAGV